MATAARPPQQQRSPWATLALLLLVSAAAHLVAFVSLPASGLASHQRNVPVEMTLYEPPPPPPPKEEPPEPEPPKPLPPPKPAPAPVVKVDAPKPPEDVPPPPNETPPETPPEGPPPPIVVGVTMSSTAAGGSFAVQVGNTTYGKAQDTVVDAAEVKPYAAPKYAPPGSADSEPQLLSEVKVDYPDEARRNEVEGNVRLRVTLSADGVVEKVVVVSGPGYGLDEAARDALRRFRFKPAMKGGEAVGYTFVYTYTFLLD